MSKNKFVFFMLLVISVCIAITTTVLADNDTNEESVLVRMESNNKVKISEIGTVRQELSKNLNNTAIKEEDAIDIVHEYATKIAKVNLNTIAGLKQNNLKLTTVTSDNLQTLQSSFQKSIGDQVDYTYSDEVTLQKNNITNKTLWYQKNENYYSRVDANTGELLLLHYNINTLVPTSKTEQEIIGIANNLYAALELKNNYKLYEISQFDATTWVVTFTEEIEGIFNPYKNVKLTILPETQTIESISIHNETCENNAIIIEEDEARQIAENFLTSRNISIDNTFDKIELAIRRANLFWNNETEYIESESTIIRKVWEITYKTNDGVLMIVYVDATTSEIIGGDAING